MLLYVDKSHAKADLPRCRGAYTLCVSCSGSVDLPHLRGMLCCVEAGSLLAMRSNEKDKQKKKTLHGLTDRSHEGHSFDLDDLLIST